MAFPDGALADGEQVVVSTHPHWSRLAVPAVAMPVVLLVTVLGVFFVPAWPVRDAVQYLIIAVAFGVLVRFSVLPWFRWVTTRYVVTTERLVVREGVMNRSSRDIPLVRLERISFHAGATERLLGCGTLAVTGVGERGPLVLSSVPNVEGVQALLYQLAEDATHRRYGG